MVHVDFSSQMLHVWLMEYAKENFPRTINHSQKLFKMDILYIKEEMMGEPTRMQD